MGPVVPRQTPYEAIRSRLVSAESAKGEEDPSLDRLPRLWERLGDVLVLRGLTKAFGARAGEVARVYAEVLGARVVLEDVGGVSGPRREPTMRRLWGDGDTVASFTQDRIRYTLDTARLMFSSGNLSEREHMGRQDARGETVVDLFAGIGYFTLPLLVHAGAERTIACELNPLAAQYLEQNARDNQVAKRLEVRVGDCRETAPRRVAHRVVSGWFPHGYRYLDVALDTLREEGGILHYHDTAHASRPKEEMMGHVEEACRLAARPLLDVDVRVVKSYAPGVVHAVADVRVGPVKGSMTVPVQNADPVPTERGS